MRLTDISRLRLPLAVATLTSGLAGAVPNIGSRDAQNIKDTTVALAHANVAVANGINLTDVTGPADSTVVQGLPGSALNKTVPDALQGSMPAPFLNESLAELILSLAPLDDDTALRVLSNKLLTMNNIELTESLFPSLEHQDNSTAPDPASSATHSDAVPQTNASSTQHSNHSGIKPAAYGNATSSAGLVRRITGSTGCGMEQLAYDNDIPTTVTVHGLQRHYYVRIPESYDPEHAYRIVFTMHAFRGSAAAVKNGDHGYDPWYGLPDQDPDDSTIFVAPHGFAGMWLNAAGEDTAFMERILADVESQLCIDQNQRYMHGYSFGGAMAHATMCHMGSAFRAVSVWSGAPISACSGRLPRPVAYYGQHGTHDAVLPVPLGRKLRDQYLLQNNCRYKYAHSPERGSGDHTVTEYTCDDNHPVVWVEFDGGHTQHPEDDWSGEQWSPRYTWDFFTRFF
ncbi:hypothetical protein BROUX41_003858 [Berkeleyomyces rouxiae]|uniref:uncharacterized protein n=1 Tax=Berkeleyomyces rouxiae TaxID=2035830 RepID=UPI003B808F42